MGMVYILRETPRGADALSPENVMTVMLGVTTGASISGQSRVNVNARSPMSGAIGDSQAGGFFPAEMKFAGFDGIVIKGKSPKPVYLALINGEASLHDASHLWGKITGEVEGMLKQELGDPKIEVMQVGPAAEKGVRFAAIMNMSNRAHGRTGMGLVMASKNLKAIVVRGKARPPVAHPEKLAALNRLGPKYIPENADMDNLAKYGTANVVNFQNTIGSLPTLNYNEGQFEQAEAISGEKMSETILKDRDTCYACVVRCKRVVEIKEGKYTADPFYGGAEYETISTFGSYCGIGDLAAISLANQICAEYGVDTISCGATIAFAMECYEKGLITRQQTGGLNLRFGDSDAMLEALRQIVTRSGQLGQVLAEGSAQAAENLGTADGGLPGHRQKHRNLPPTCRNPSVPWR